ncbi:MAG: PEGA domain-containing protein [Bacteroidetes bacterium]|jgi:hypothetical protein|nr:PEGA domain-containing protein [Bacteroidota bacterium]
MPSLPSSQRPERPPARGKRKLPPTEEEPQWYVPPPEPPSLGDRLRDLLPHLIFPLAVLLFGLAVAALLYFDPFALRDTSDPGPETLSERVDVLQRPLAEPDPVRAEPALATFTTAPGGVTILVDGDSIGTSPVTDHRLAAGAYILSFSHERYFRRDTLIVVDGGSSPSYAFQMRSRDPVEELARLEGRALPSQTPAPPPATSPQASPQASPPPQANTEPEPAPEPAPAVGTLVISSQPDGATVLLNGEAVGTTPLTVRRPAGTYQVQVQQDGYRTYASTIEVTAGDTRTEVASLDVRTGTLRVLPRPWGSVYINGELRVSETNVRYTTELPVGTHTVEVRHPSLGRQERQVTVAADSSTSIEVNLRGQE